MRAPALPLLILLTTACLAVPGFDDSDRGRDPAQPANGGGDQDGGDQRGGGAGGGDAEGTDGDGPGIDDPGAGVGDDEHGGGANPGEDDGGGAGGDEPAPPTCDEGELHDGDRCRIVFQQIQANRLYSCGLTPAGRIHCWGHARNGLLDPPDGEFTSIDLGTDHSCAMDAESRLTCWGQDIQGDFGKAIEDVPNDRFIGYAVGTNTTCVLAPGGFVRCWGSDYQGQAQIDGEGPFDRITAGAQTFCGIRADKTAQCWGWQGWNGDHEKTWTTIWANNVVCGLGLDPKEIDCFNGRRPQDNLHLDLPEGEWEDLSLGRDMACAIRDGSVKCFATDDDPFYDPFPADNHGLHGLSVGDDHACALRENGTAFCWGDNSRGQTDAP